MSDFDKLTKGMADASNAFSLINNSAKRSAAISGVRADRTLLVSRYGEAAYAEILERVKQGADYEALLNILAQRARQTALKNNPPPLDGSARWASWQELKQAELVQVPEERPASAEIYFGAYKNEDPQLRQREDNWLYWNGEGHLLTIAPTGAGKSAVQLIPNLLRYTGSCVVLDPKGELYQATSQYRSKIGKVFRLAPFAERTDAFNPMDGVRSFEEAQEFAQILYPPESQGDGAFYENEARSFLTMLVYFLSNAGMAQMRTLRQVRRFTMLPLAKFKGFLKKLAEEETQPDFVQDTAAMFTELKDEVLTTLKRSLSEKLQMWDSEALQRATSHSDFSFSDLKDETVTVYITVPFHRMDAYARYLQLMLTAALEAMVATERRPKQPVLFMLDEFLRLGYFPRFVHAMRTHRDAGVRLWFIMQSQADMEMVYRDTWRVFFANASVKSYFGVRDNDTAETISKLLGQQTVAYESGNVSQGVSGSEDADGLNRGGHSANASEGIQYKGRALLDAREVQRLLSGSDPMDLRLGILDFAGVEPVQALHLPWYRGYDFLCRFGNREAPIKSSPALLYLWQCFNDEFFAGRLAPIADIGTVDFSLGRDGFIRTRPDVLAFYDAENTRIILPSGAQAILDALEPLLDLGYSEDQKDAAFAYLAPLTLHEMLHQDTIARTGDKWENHGPEFLATAQQVHAAVQAKPNSFQWPAPTQELVHNWPPFPSSVTTFKQLGIPHPSGK